MVTASSRSYGARLRVTFPRSAAPSHASINDEASSPAFQQTAAELETRIGFLLATLTAPTTPS